MSTNFYTFCRCCKSQLKHLGQSAGPQIGFLLQANGFEDYRDWPEMQAWLEGQAIQNEYGDEITLDEFKGWVEFRKENGRPRKEFDSEGVIDRDGYEFYNREFS